MNRALLLTLLAPTAIALVAAAPVHPADEASSPQVQAAAASGREQLRQQISATLITRNVTVGDVLGHTGGYADLEQALSKSQQIGGTRWLDEQTVQIRVMVEGADIAHVVIAAVDHDPAHSPVPPQVVRQALARWPTKTFSAVGVSTAGNDLNRFAPPANDPAWATVGREDCHRALAMARTNAVQQVIDSLRPIDLGSDRTLDLALRVPEVQQAVSAWLESRPVRAVDFRPDRSVRLTLDVPADQLWKTMHLALAKQAKVKMPVDAAGWDWLAKQVEARMAAPTGTGQAAPAARQLPAVVLQIPNNPPRWASEIAVSQASSPPRVDRLKTARAAEALALEKLRQQVMELPLSEGVSLGQASNMDTRIGDAITHELNRAKPYQVDYDAKGGATVHVSMSLGNLWYRICTEH